MAEGYVEPFKMKRLILLFGCALLTSAVASAQMPDVSQMSGIPLPSGDLPAGDVSVRVVRGALSNNITNQPVELHGGGQIWRASTDESGRATFSALPVGTSVHAVTFVDGTRIESQEFPVPPTSGVRIVLVAQAGGAGSGGGASADGGTGPIPTPLPPAAPGTVILAGQSRFIVDIVDEAVEFYALLDVINPAQDAVQTAPLVFDLPDDAIGLTVLEGSSPQAKVEGRQFVVSGPFAPGRTLVQVAYQVPYGGSRVSLRQVLPAPLANTSLLVRKLGDATFTSPQVSERREVPIDNQTYYAASGPGLAAGAALEIELNGLPYHSRIPRIIALVLVGLLVGFGVWLSVGAGAAGTEIERRQLESRRDALFAELVVIEAQHERGEPTGVRSRREELIAELEEIYARLDEIAPAAASSSGGSSREGVAVEPSFRTHRV